MNILLFYNFHILAHLYNSPHRQLSVLVDIEVHDGSNCINKEVIEMACASSADVLTNIGPTNKYFATLITFFGSHQHDDIFSQYINAIGFVLFSFAN